jgi:hypothetical protein
MPQNRPVEEVLHDVLAELVRLLVVLDECPDQASTSHLEYLSRQVMGYSVALSSDLMDTVAGVENLAVSLADLHDKLRVNHRCAGFEWCGVAEGYD